MRTVDITTAQKDFFKVIAKVNETSEPIILTNSTGKNAILVGEDDWNAIQETIYLNSVSGMTDSLKKGMATPLEECIKEEDISW